MKSSQKAGLRGQERGISSFQGGVIRVSEYFSFNFIRNQNMNDVIFYLWMSDIVAVARFVAGFMLLGGIVLSGVLLVASADDKAKAVWLIPSISFSLLMLCATILTPSPRTMEILAATSAVDLAAVTPLGKKATQALNSILDRMIEPQQKQKKGGDDIF
jgi:hypothetical protein